MFLIDIKSKIYLYKGVYKSISNTFGYPEYFGSDWVGFWFFRYQNFEPVWIFNQFWFGFSTTFSGRVWFGSSDSDFLPSLSLVDKSWTPNLSIQWM